MKAFSNPGPFISWFLTSYVSLSGSFQERERKEKEGSFQGQERDKRDQAPVIRRKIQPLTGAMTLHKPFMVGSQLKIYNEKKDKRNLLQLTDHEGSFPKELP